MILGSGPEEMHERLEPMFDAIGKRSMWVGEARGKFAPSFKLALAAKDAALVEART